MFISGCAFYLDCLSLDQTKCQGFFMIDIASVSPLDSRTELFEQYLLKHYIEGKDFTPSLWASDEIDRPHTQWAQSQYFQIFTQTGQSASTDTNKTQRHRAKETSKKKRQKKKTQERITLGHGLQTLQRRQNHQV